MRVWFNRQLPMNNRQRPGQRSKTLSKRVCKGAAPCGR